MKRRSLTDPERRLLTASEAGLYVNRRRVPYRGGRVLGHNPVASKGRPQPFDKAAQLSDALFGDHAARLATFERGDA